MLWPPALRLRPTNAAEQAGEHATGPALSTRTQCLRERRHCKLGHRLAIKKNPRSAAFPMPATAHREFGMIKSDLVWRLRRQRPHLLLRDVEKIVDAIFDEITAALACGKRIELRGFGTFSVKIWEARTGRNPRTGVPASVPKKALPRFKTAKETRERLNRREE